MQRLIDWILNHPQEIYRTITLILEIARRFRDREKGKKKLQENESWSED